MGLAKLLQLTDNQFQRANRLMLFRGFCAFSVHLVVEITKAHIKSNIAQ